MSRVEFLPELHLRAINHRNTDVQSVTVVMTYNPGIQEAAAGKVRVSDECGLYSETLFQKIQGEREAGGGGMKETSSSKVLILFSPHLS